MSEDTERRIRDAMREFEVGCPSCGSDTLSVEKTKDTDVGVMDEFVCCDCEHSFTMISSVHTQFVS
jgi:transposase-like protein